MNFRRTRKIIRGLRDIQKQSVGATEEQKRDDYMVGLYNGLEIALSFLENREANLISGETKETEVIEREETGTNGRTQYSGIIRR